MKLVHFIIRIFIIIFFLTNTQTSAQIKRSLVDFTDQHNSSRITEKRLAIINDLRTIAAQLESSSDSNNEHWWQNPELQQPLKCFIIAATMHLGLDLVKCAAQGCLSAALTNPMLLLIKTIFQGGIPGLILGSAGTWGRLPELSTSALVTEKAISQLILECFDRLSADLLRNKTIDWQMYLAGTSIAIPTAQAMLHGLLLWARREDLLQEKHLITAVLRELGSGPKLPIKFAQPE